MDPRIDDYIRVNRGTYNDQAIREQLIAAGHDPAEVDTALRETEAARGARGAETRIARRRFWRWTISLHIAAWVLATVWLLLGRTTPGYVWIGVVALGVVLLIGLTMSGLIGRALLGRGMAVAWWCRSSPRSWSAARAWQWPDR